MVPRTSESHSSASVIKCEFGSAVNLIFMAALLTAAEEGEKSEEEEEEVMLEDERRESVTDIGEEENT